MSVIGLDDGSIAVKTVVSPLPPLPEGGEISFFIVGPLGHGRFRTPSDFPIAVSSWVKAGTSHSLECVVHVDQGCPPGEPEGTSSQIEYESRWTGDSWTEWNQI